MVGRINHLIAFTVRYAYPFIPCSALDLRKLEPGTERAFILCRPISMISLDCQFSFSKHTSSKLLNPWRSLLSRSDTKMISAEKSQKLGHNSGVPAVQLPCSGPFQRFNAGPKVPWNPHGRPLRRLVPAVKGHILRTAGTHEAQTLVQHVGIPAPELGKVPGKWEKGLAPC